MEQILNIIVGGDLALEKFIYSYMDWLYKKGEECLVPMVELPGSINIHRSGDGVGDITKVGT